MFIYVPELCNDHPHSMVAALLTTTTTRITTVLNSATVLTSTIPVWPVPLIRPSATTSPPTPAPKGPKGDTIGQATLDIHIFAECVREFMRSNCHTICWDCIELILCATVPCTGGNPFQTPTRCRKGCYWSWPNMRNKTNPSMLTQPAATALKSHGKHQGGLRIKWLQGFAPSMRHVETELYRSQIFHRKVVRWFGTKLNSIEDWLEHSQDFDIAFNRPLSGDYTLGVSPCY